jgi:glycosyltransferase involved in cell wall biosynthesis
LIERAWRRRADCLVVHSAQLTTALGNVPQRVEVLAHGADVLVAPLPPPQTPAVLLFGRLEPYKGIRVLSSAMEHVWQTRPNVRLLVCGKGPSVNDLPDDPRVEARLEYIPESDVDPIFARATLVVLPYTDASQSGVGTMAVARGIPTIVSRIGGLPDLALDDSLVVPPGDPAALAAAIVRHVDDGEEIRKRVLRLAEERLGWDAVGLAALDLYRDLT